MVKFIKQILGIISKRDKRRLFALLFMILISSFLDLIGISAIVPVVSLLSAPDVSSAINGDLVLKILSSVFCTQDAFKLSIIALIFMASVYFIKVGYAFLLTYANNKFTMSFNRRLREKLMRVYLAMPYEFHHENNSSTLIRKSTYDVDIFTSAVSGLLEFIVKISTIIVIAIYLFVSSYITTFIIGGFLVFFAFLIIYILRKKIRKLGADIQNLNSYNYKYLSQSFNGVKESKISNTEEYFISQYSKNIFEINRLSLRKNMYGSVPGHSLEFVGMLGMTVSLLAIVLIGNSTNYQIISTFSVFAYAVIRLLPCVTVVTTYVNNFAFYSASVNSIYNDLEQVKILEGQIEISGPFEPMPFDTAIKLNDVSFAYKDEPDRSVVKSVAFDIHKNTSVAISGKSGAGKTTLVDIILGLLKPTEGSVTCDDIDINSNVKGWRDNLSYVPQNIYLMDDTIRNNVMFGVDAHNVDDRRIWEALDKAQLREFVEQSPKGLDTIIGERGIRLSGGQRQRIGIARAFYRNTNIIVLDEATSALDYETEKNILDHVTEFSKDHTLIIITHRLNTIESCDYIYKIEEGRIQCVKSK